MRIFLIAPVLLFLGCGDDISPPTTPENLIVNAVSPTQMSVSWDASTDNVGVEGYKVFRDGSFHIEVAVNGLMDAVVNSTTYCYAVSAFDKEINESALSETKCDKTPAIVDTEKPSIPTGIIANALSSSQIFLIWNASTDDIGVTGYNIYNAVGTPEKIDTVNALSYIHNGLTANIQYCYSVSAFDRAGNVSTLGVASCATTDPL